MVEEDLPLRVVKEIMKKAWPFDAKMEVDNLIQISSCVTLTTKEPEIG